MTMKSVRQWALLTTALVVIGAVSVSVESTANLIASTSVPNIFWAKPGDYRKATQRIYNASGDDLKLASFIELPLVTTP